MAWEPFRVAGLLCGEITGHLRAITCIVILELQFNSELESGGTGSSCDCLIIRIAMLYHDIYEMMMNNVVHAELYEEARGIRIFLYSILYGGSDRKHYFMNMEFYCKFYV